MIGRGPILTRDFGTVSECSRSRVPRPPQKSTTFIAYYPRVTRRFWDRSGQVFSGIPESILRCHGVSPPHPGNSASQVSQEPSRRSEGGPCDGLRQMLATPVPFSRVNGRLDPPAAV